MVKCVLHVPLLVPHISAGPGWNLRALQVSGFFRVCLHDCHCVPSDAGAPFNLDSSGVNMVHRRPSPRPAGESLHDGLDIFRDVSADVPLAVLHVNLCPAPRRHQGCARRSFPGHQFATQNSLVPGGSGLPWGRFPRIPNIFHTSMASDMCPKPYSSFDFSWPSRCHWPLRSLIGVQFPLFSGFRRFHSC